MSFKLAKYIEPDFNEKRFKESPDVKFKKVIKDGVAPKEYHALSIYPEYLKVNGKWTLVEETRMDCVPVLEGKKVKAVEFRNLKVGDMVAIGRKEDASRGIYVHYDCWDLGKQKDELFAFRQGRSRETSFSYDYRTLAELLKYEKDHNGYVVWIMGPACSFDKEAKKAFAKLVKGGYCQALLAGNALATHDLEGEYLGTALGCDIENQHAHKLGHYNHLDTINAVRGYGSIPEFIKKEKIKGGIIATCEKNKVPYVLTGSIRDDGPLPEVLADCYEGQDEIRSHIRKATTVIGMATMLHTIATGNMTPIYRTTKNGTKRPVYFYIVDASEFMLSKLSDRGSLAAKGIVTNVQDFLKNLEAEIKK